MIVFAYSPYGISVIQTFPRHSLDSIGRRQIGIGRFEHDPMRHEWLWDAGRANLDIYRTLDHTEKREIIGMLDALNQVAERPITNLKRRWEEIIGHTAVKMLSDGAIPPMDR